MKFFTRFIKRNFSIKIINIKNRKVIQVNETKQISVDVVLVIIAILASFLLFYILMTGNNLIEDLYEIIDSSSK